ncbi:hypothetical protein RE0327_27650 [Prescottella equi]|nr:hypothetical protein RE0327_27650 [Prescottella equi]
MRRAQGSYPVGVGHRRPGKCAESLGGRGVVEQDHRADDGRLGGDVDGGHHATHRGVAQHVVTTRGRGAGIDGNVAAACGDDGQQCDDQIVGAVQDDAHRNLRPHPERDQPARELVRARGQLRVCEPKAPPDHCDPIGGLRGSARHQRGQGLLDVGPRPLPRRQPGRERRGVHERQFADGSLGGRVQQGVQQTGEPVVMGAEGRVVVEFRIGLEVEANRPGRPVAVDVDEQILDRPGGEDVERGAGVAEAQFLREQHEVQQRSREAAAGAVRAAIPAQVLVPVPLMTQRTGQGRGHLGHQLPDRRSDADRHPQWHDVRKRAAGAAQYRRRARGDRQTQHDVLGAGVSRRVRSDRRCDENRDAHAVPVLGLVESRCGVGRDDTTDITPECPCRRGPLRETAPFGHPRRPLRPVVAVGPPALGPDVRRIRGIDGIEIGGPGGGRLAALDGRVVQIRDPVEHGRRTHPVERDVMGPGVPEPAIVGDAEKYRYREPVTQQVQRSRHIGPHPGVRRRLRIRLAAQIDDPGARIEPGIQDLVRPRIDQYQTNQTRTELAGRSRTGPREEVDVESARPLADVHVLGHGHRYGRVELLRQPLSGLRGRERHGLGAPTATALGFRQGSVGVRRAGRCGDSKGQFHQLGTRRCVDWMVRRPPSPQS